MGNSADRKTSRFSSLGWRLLGAALLVPAFIFIFLEGGWLILVANCLWISKLLHEFSKMADSRGHRRLFPALLPFLLAIIIACHCWGSSAGMAMFTAACLLVMMFDALRGRIENASATCSEKIMVIFYLGLLPGYWLLLRRLPLEFDLDYALGGKWLLFAGGVTWLSDTFAYFVGVLIGRHKLKSAVSPQKTIEGMIGGLVGAVISAILLAPHFIKVPLVQDGETLGELVPLLVTWQAVLAGVVIALSSQLGDLFESLLKRDAAVKDSGKEIPGHGGFLDRVDSMLFSLPVFYYFLFWVLSTS
ncbi:MAG: phosphatidate cytidylyltransferase [bacterium]|nr:phosphatidate cytidylyltransferase [bacterium]